MTQPLTERLRRTHIAQTMFGGVGAGAFHEMPVNPNGPEAADRIDALEATQAELVEALKRLSGGRSSLTECYSIARGALSKLEAGQ